MRRGPITLGVARGWGWPIYSNCMYDWLVVGAGFSGAVMAERIATRLGQRVLVVDKRNHIAGNAYDHLDESGVLVHDYGPHIFHTNSERVWDYLSGFTDWRSYEHRVRAVIDGKEVPVPFNLTSLGMLFPKREARRLERILRQTYGHGAQVPVLKMMEEAEPALRELGEFVYEKMFLGYTIKQWGVRPEELSGSVTARIPVRIGRDDRYFQDRFQAMPGDGYTAMFERMLAHRNIRVILGVDWRSLPKSVRYGRMVYTGPIDEFFKYAHGPLPYRSLRFEFEHSKKDLVQSVGQLNYPNGEAYTRVTEFKHLTGQKTSGTTVAREYPLEHVPGESEPFYPIPREENRAIFEKYKAEARKLGGAVIFTGRLADYQYYNMDQVVARALMLFEQEVAGESRMRGAGDTEPKIAAA
jgi:UDP-galactopyranose mutase